MPTLTTNKSSSFSLLPIYCMLISLRTALICVTVNNLKNKPLTLLIRDNLTMLFKGMTKFKWIAWLLIYGQLLLLAPPFSGFPSTARAASLTILDGVTVKSATEGQIIVRDSLNAGKTRFTSGSGTPSAGDWKGIKVEGSATGTQFNGSLIEFSGASGSPAIDVRKSSPLITGVEIRNNSSAGIRLTDGASPSVRDAVITGNTLGIEVGAGTHPSVLNSVFSGNNTNILNLDPANIVNATNNWWGHPTGPNDPSNDTSTGGLYNPGGLGSLVSDGVNYSPWSNVIPVLGASFNIAEGALTGSQNINLNLSCSTCTEFRASESSNFTGASFQPFNISSPFTLSAGDALKTIYAQFRTSTGNTSQALSDQIRFDTAGPLLTVNNPAAGSVIQRPQTIDVTAADPAGIKKVEFYIDGLLAFTDTTNNFSYPWDVTSASDGGHEIRIVAWDNADHTTTDIRPVTVIKAAPPAPQITSPATGTVSGNTSVNVSGNAEAGISVSLYVNNSFYAQTTANINGVFLFTGVSLSEGSSNLSATASDNIGTSPSSPLVLVTVDTGAPAAPAIYSSASLAGGKIRLDWATGSGETPVGYRVYRRNSTFTTTGQAAKIYDGTKTTLDDIPPSDGIYYYGVTAFDGAGNESLLSAIVSATSDRQAPSGIVEFIPASPAGPGDVSVMLTLSEPVTGTPYLGIAPFGEDAGVIELSRSTDTEWSGVYHITGAMPNGMAALSFYATDVIGNKGTQLTSGASLYIDTAGPWASVQVTPASGIHNPGVLTVSVTLNESAPQAPLLTFNPPSGVPVNVSLAGSGTNWSGSLEILASMGDGGLNVNNEATDGFGNVGTNIVSGSTLALDVTSLAAPASLSAISRPAGNIRLDWSQQQDAAGYRAYRVSSGEVIQLPSTPVADNLIGTTHTDLPPSDGNYVYAITALDSAGNESGLSPTAETVSDRIVPGAPSNLALSIVNSDVLASWDAPSGETGLVYNLYRSTSPITTVTGLTPVHGSINQVSSVDTPPADATYYYVITALDASGNESLPSAASNIVYNFAPPSINIAGVSEGQYLSSPVTPVIIVTDESLGTVVMFLDGAPYTSGTAIGGEGGHILRVEAEDTSSRITVREISFTIDLTNPVINVSGVTAGTGYEVPVTPVVTATDTNLDRIEIRLNGLVYQSGTQINADGAYSLNITAWDLSGRSSNSAITFGIDAAPPPPALLDIVVNNTSAAILTWGSSPASDVSGYHVYKNGQRQTLTPLNGNTFTDNYYDNSLLQAYGISAVDGTGHEGLPISAGVIPVKVSLNRYGNNLNSDFILSKHYIESLRVEVLNQHSSAGNIGPVNMELLDSLGIIDTASMPNVSYSAGESKFIEQIMPVGEGIVDFRVLNVSVQLPSDPGISIRHASSFNLNAYDPGRKIEIFNDPLIRGGMAKVRVKIYNHGSAPIEVVTQIGDNPSPDVYVLLRDQNGNVLGKGNLKQRGIGVINYSGYSLAEIAPGGSFLSAPVEFLIPLSAPDNVYLDAYVSNIYYHYSRPDQVIGGNLSGHASASISQAPYFATISSDRPDYDQNTPVVLSGEALDSVTNNPVPNVPVKIGISVKGFDRYFVATTDDTGRYSLVFNPLTGEAGIYSLWATHPTVYDKPVSGSFIIHGLSFEPRAVNLRMSKNSSFSMPVTVKNLGETDLTGMQFYISGGTGITGSVDTGGLVLLQGGRNGSIRITLDAAIDAPDASSATLVVTTSEGIVRSLDVNIALLQALPTIDTSPRYIEVGLNTNNFKVVTFKLKNTGFATLDNIQIDPPATSWMGVSAGEGLLSLAVGESADISVSFRPSADVTQGPYTDKIIIRSSNHVPYTLNIFAMVTSSDKGGVHFKVIDGLAELVKGANVTIGHQQVNTLVLSGKADDLGEILFGEIPVGMYNFKVEAPGHQIATGTFEVTPEVITPMDILMTNVFVTLEWSVTPMTLLDKYEVKLEATYETQVPAAVITIEPAYEKLELEIGSTYVGEYRVTNHGLVALEDVKIVFNYAPGLIVEGLISELPRIGAKETIIIPYRITVNRFKSPEPVDGCSPLPMTVNVGGGYYCLFGTLMGSGVTGSKTIIPKDTYDLLGLCDLACDWCECILYPPAAALCKCLKNRSLCDCAGLFGSDTANAVCSCISGAGGDTNKLIECAEAIVGGAAIGAIKQAASLLDAFKNGFKCGLCIKDLLPSFPVPTVSGTPGGGGGGGWGGGCFGCGGGGFSLSGGGC